MSVKEIFINKSPKELCIILALVDSVKTIQMLQNMLEMLADENKNNLSIEQHLMLRTNIFQFIDTHEKLNIERIKMIELESKTPKS
jgi:uncharacterized protein YjaG (DUF416 family)